MGQLYTAERLQRIEDGLRDVLAEWGLSSKTRLSLLNISENATFRADDPNRSSAIVLRVYRSGYHTTREILSELAWIDQLRRDQVIVTPEPLRLTSGHRLAEFDAGDGPLQATAFAFMSGREPRPTDDLTAWFVKLGAISAKLHTHSLSKGVPHGFQRKRWTFQTMFGAEPLWGDWRAAIGLTIEGADLLERCAAKLEADLAEFGTGPDRFGLIHADLRLANLLIEEDRLGVIDFDDCGFSWFMYDFAAAISFFEHEPGIPDLMEAWIAGYDRIRPLESHEVHALPQFVMARRLLLTAWLASHSETPTAQDLGANYTEGTLTLADAYLAGRFLV